MKRLTTLLLLLCCLPFMAMAQDLNPGQQSQGLLESRNVTVDYSTGIFHYQIPLYTLKSGDYELPISLRYTGKGVKVSDKPGLVGYNWTLDTGGIVTRTVRGGIPDEKPLYGYLHFENDSIPLSEDATRVNRHKRDGECDIFTAVFGSKSVNFIIRKDGNGDLYAEPLERTDVKIECEGSRSFISGWTVTDNDGTRYNYMRTEWTCNLNKQDEISFNGLSNLEYVSSWHLTSIEPVNSKAIEFKYLGTEAYSPLTYQQRENFYYNSYQTKYEYGRPMEMPVYDFEAYKERFEEYFNDAMAAVQNYDLQLQMEDQLLIFETGIGWLQNPNYDFINWQRMVNHRVLGMGDASQVSEISTELLARLENLVIQYKDLNNSVSHKFEMAYNILLDCVDGVLKEVVRERELKGGISYKVISPILDAIHADEKILFKYYPQHDTLYCIKKETLKGNTISTYNFTRDNYNRLGAIISLDKDSVATSVVSMAYYTTPEGETSMADVYGYRKRKTNDPDAKYQPWAEEEYAKIHSLKEIHSADGGKIRLDYELNGLPNATEGVPFGGIRIKSIVLDNPTEERCDTISYHYEQAFHTFWDFPKNYEEERYSNFTDRILHSKVKSQGHATLSPGNNGLYYPIVREKISGQGTRWLCFNFTDYGRDWSHSHWLTGLPTYTIELNEEGNVERATEYLYYTDVENGLAPCLFSESLIHLDAASYNKVLPQMVANEKYMDLEDLKREMNIGPVENMTTSHERAFWTNIAPRIRNSYTNIVYSQYYGGATVLAEQREYRPLAGECTDYMTLMEQQPCSRTVYHYDNLQEHTRPTRIVTYSSQGDSSVVHQVYVGDMVATASEAIAAMQEANILVPVVKRTTVKDGALVEEEMTEYVTIPKEGGCYYAPEKIMVRSDNNDNYQVRKEMESAIIGEDSCLPIGVTEKGMHTALLHDPNSKWCVLQATDVSADKVLAVDCRHYRQKNFANGSDMMGRILFLAEKMQEGIDNYNPESIRLDSYQEFRSTVFYQYGKSFLEVLGKGTDDVCAAITAMLDTCSTDVHMGTEEYISWQIRLAYDYFPMTGNDSNWDMSLEEMQELGALLMEELYMNDGRNLLEYLQTFDGSLRSGADFEPYTLTTLLEQPNYMLYVVPIRTDVCVIYTINHSGGTAEGTVELFGVTPGVLQCVCLDLSGYNHVTGITVTEFGTLQHLTLVPEGAEFEAVSYNADGTVALKYNQDGQMQYYEYDNAGRLIRVRDENGETLDTSDYHVKNTTF